MLRTGPGSAEGGGRTQHALGPSCTPFSAAWSSGCVDMLPHSHVYISWRW